jgi:uncharacterized protein DUF4412
MRKLISALAVVLSAGSARAAVTIVTQHANGASSTITLDGDHVRIDHPEGNERATTTIIDAAAKKIVMVNDHDKSYSELTEADRQRMKEMMEARRTQMKDRLGQLPPEQRKKIEEAMAQRGGGFGEPGAAAKEPASKFEPLGSKKTINGFSCQMYRRLQEGKVREELCVAPWSAAILQKSDFAAVQKFAASMMEDMGGPRRPRRNPLADLDQYPGMPISRVPIDADGKRGEEEQIKSIKRGSVPAAKFTPPAGYTKRELPFARGPRAGGGPHGGGPPEPSAP